jgi:hypothetical protein
MILNSQNFDVNNLYTIHKSGGFSEETSIATQGVVSIDPILEIFSAVPLVYNDGGKISITDTLSALKELDELVYKDIHKGTGLEIAKLIVLVAEVSRTALIGPFKDRLPNEHKALTPLFMYAHKKYNQVPYEQWDKRDPKILFAIGAALHTSLFATPKHDLDMDLYGRLVEVSKHFEKHPELIPEYREKLYGERSVTQYKKRAMSEAPPCNLYVPYTSIASCILIQSWIAHPTLRVPGAMLLDIVNWDKVPRPIAGGLVTKVPKEQKPRTKKPKIEDALPF